MPKINELQVNGIRHTVSAEAEESLLGVLREQLDLTGTKYGCGEGQCGACTVLVDGLPRRSCITTVGAAAGKRITTIEGVAANGRLHPVQQAFLESGAMQCAYCTSGMILTAYAFLKSHAEPREAEIARFMEGNICRCGTYPRIVTAIGRASRMMKEARR
ncbi:MAG TPA: (2Fe-2S)-binding protein [Terriglobia bacterium]|nr:(2Fe-2S)-binding protein [Terriglobia bacterium]